MCPSRIGAAAVLVLVLPCACVDVRPTPPALPFTSERAPDDATGAQTHAARALVARGFVSPQACATDAAFAFARDNHDGWARLTACVARPDFNDLDALVDEPWPRAILARADGPAQIARVMARRGGDVERDLRLCRRAGLRLYSLRAALAAPDDVRGALVVMRGAFGDVRHAHGTRAVELEETRPMTDEDLLYDDELVTRRLRATRQSLHELSVETGLTLVARIADVTEPSTDYVVLLRFDGERDVVSAGDPTTRSAVGTVLASFENESSLYAWRTRK